MVNSYNGTLSHYDNDYPAPRVGLDVAFGFIYTLCVVVGLPCNLLALRYFYLKQKDLATYLYLVLAIISVIITCYIAPSQFYYPQQIVGFEY